LTRTDASGGFTYLLSRRMIHHGAASIYAAATTDFKRRTVFELTQSP